MTFLKKIYFHEKDDFCYKYQKNIQSFVISIASSEKKFHSVICSKSFYNFRREIIYHIE